MPERSLSPQRLAYLRAQKRRRRVVLALQVLLLAAWLEVPQPPEKVPSPPLAVTVLPPELVTSPLTL